MQMEEQALITEAVALVCIQQTIHPEQAALALLDL
jgi:hypothetical protein